jgi:hypothetical protein
LHSQRRGWPPCPHWTSICLSLMHTLIFILLFA